MVLQQVKKDYTLAHLSESNENISVAKLSKMLSNIGDVIVIVDNKGMITYKSPNVEKHFGWKPQELIGEPTWKNVHSDDLEATQYFFKTTLKEPNASGAIECRYRCKDGSFKWIKLSGKNLLHDKDINGILGEYHDISDRKIAQHTIQENEARFRSLFQNLTNSSSLYEVVEDDLGNPVDYRFLGVNPAYEQGIGLKESQLLGKTLLEIFPETEPIWLDTLKEVYLTGKPVQVENYSKEINRYFELIVYKFQKSKIAMIGADITDRKLNELEIIKAKEKAEESDRLKSAFLQNMSHEIRTPLNAICGFSNFLNEPNLSEERKKNYVSIINSSSDQLLSIVNDILTISSLETKQEIIIIENFNVNDVIDELHEIFKRQLRTNDIPIILNKTQPLSQLQVSSDKTKVTQILSNLINNALKFTTKGFVEFGYSLKQDVLEFYVKDTGIGIESDIHESIFKRFQQADDSISRRYGGSGLGLSISKGYVELLNGKIWVESELGKGATFFFTIPYVFVKEEENAKFVVKEPKNSHYTILVAEDEEVNFLFIEELLKNKDFILVHATNGEEAVEVCRINQDIDLILMDIKMPKLDGYSAAKIIKELNPDIPIIAQTAYALNTEVDKYKDAFDEYITKPIKSSILIEIINKCLKI